MLNDLELTGRARTHVTPLDALDAALQHDAAEPFLAMKNAAMREGIDIRIVSAFRDFAAQQKIWDGKYLGGRPLYDAHGNVREHAQLSAEELVDAIVCWSAVPGASRHHWGTEIDVIDRAALPEGYRVRLLPDEAQAGGVFHRLHCWLDANMARFSFYRPYRTYRGGVHPEPWHLSYAPVAVPALQALTPALLEEAVRGSSIQGRALVLARIGEIHRRYVANVDEPHGPGQQAIT
jgi:LAS superfamily LD-carboxypeptidase LdcB